MATPTRYFKLRNHTDPVTILLQPSEGDFVVGLIKHNAHGVKPYKTIPEDQYGWQVPVDDGSKFRAQNGLLVPVRRSPGNPATIHLHLTGVLQSGAGGSTTLYAFMRLSQGEHLLEPLQGSANPERLPLFAKPAEDRTFARFIRLVV